MITRNPYHQAHTSIIQLRPKSFEAKDGDQENMQIFDVPSPGALAMTGVGEILNSISTGMETRQGRGWNFEYKGKYTDLEGIKVF